MTGRGELRAPAVLRAMGRYGWVGRIAARQQWAYRSELLLRTVSMVLFMSIFIALWHTAYATGERRELAGYTLAQMIWYLGMTETVALSSSRIFIDISEAVKTGDLAYTLTRPIPYPFFQIANSLGNSLPRFGMNLATATVVVYLGTQTIVGSWAGLAAFLVTACLALLLDALIAVLIGLTAFWLEDVTPVFWIYQKLIFTVGGLFLPLEIFPTWLAQLAAWLPFRLITYVPARTFVAFDATELARNVSGQLAYLVALTAAVGLAWRYAQRRLTIHGG
jgi:ABC-2 type transport system permease protein